MSEQSPEDEKTAGEDGPADAGRAGLRREAFLTAARDVFLQHGYEQASMAEIVRRAGGSLSTLYAQFGGKRGLFEAMIDRRVVDLTAQMHVELAAHAPLREGLQRIGLTFLSKVMEPDSLDVLRLMAGQAKKFPEMAGGYGRQGIDRVRGALAEYLKDRAEAGEIVLNDHDAAAGVFFDLLRGRMQLRAIFDVGYAPTEADIRETVDRAVKVFLGGAEGV
jgi:AcrR family transcriptional regulator